MLRARDTHTKKHMADAATPAAAPAAGPAPPDVKGGASPPPPPPHSVVVVPHPGRAPPTPPSPTRHLPVRRSRRRFVPLLFPPAPDLVRLDSLVALGGGCVTVGAVLTHAASPLLLPLLLANAVAGWTGLSPFASFSVGGWAGAAFLLLAFLAWSALAGRIVASARAAHLEEEGAELTHERVWAGVGAGGVGVPQPSEAGGGGCAGGVCGLPAKAAGT